MWLTLQQEAPDDYVIGTDGAHTVQDYVEEAFGYVGRDWQRYVAVDSRNVRPVETPSLVSNAAKARRMLGWVPQVGFQELVWIMVDADLEASGVPPPGEGKRILREKFDAWHQWQGAVQDVLASVQQGVS